MIFNKYQVSYKSAYQINYNIKWFKFKIALLNQS
jgi:hypothetical protein